MGWNADWIEGFSGINSNLAKRPGWQDWNTELHINAGVVNGGVAKLINVDPPGGDGGDEDQSVSGAVTSVSRIPTFDSTSNHRNRWTVVADFYPKVRHNPNHGHVGIFLRARNRTYKVSGSSGTYRDMTRFGCFIRTGTNVPQAALQFDGDKLSNTKYKARFIQRFSLSENPFDHPNTKYRIQIIEEEYMIPIYGWKLRWIGEVWKRPGESNAVKIGEYNYINEVRLEDENVKVPSLSGSRIALGSGPARAGEVHIDQVANAGWEY